VAISLLALVVVPVPFLRSMGIGGMLIPLVSTGGAHAAPAILGSIGRGSTGRGSARDAPPAAGRPGPRASSAAVVPPASALSSARWSRRCSA
jgi:RND superfamily putative drug exporter